jgi:hypothetical protein
MDMHRHRPINNSSLYFVHTNHVKICLDQRYRLYWYLYSISFKIFMFRVHISPIRTNSMEQNC